MARTKRVVRHCLSPQQEKRLKARGLGATDAVQISKLFNCSMEELLGMYKCRKSMIQHPVAKAKLWLRKNRPDEQKNGRPIIYHDISPLLETWVPCASCGEGDVVLVMDKKGLTYRVLAQRCHKIERLHTNGFKYPETKIDGVMLTPSAALEHGVHVIAKGSRVSVLQSNACAVEGDGEDM